jgi:alkanesulfonate monooxygenase SsuD/methylene tetrahydromethanopterin reductase-like flavin-dependent oxidoreductase (luciferase family)
MKLGLYLRNMGPQSSPATIVASARAAEAAGLDELWLADHIAIPPDQAEGSGGRYLDPLATLAFLAGKTERIHLGTGVLVLPYRPPLATAKWIATIQELSAGRVLFGVGVGWMEPEFRAVGVPYAERGRVTDATLAFIAQCFAADEAEANGQPFLFLPRPKRPPILVGGMPLLPKDAEPALLREPIATLRERMRAAGKPEPEVAVLTELPLDDPSAAAARLHACAEVGATRVGHAWRYADAAAFGRAAEALAKLGS